MLNVLWGDGAALAKTAARLSAQTEEANAWRQVKDGCLPELVLPVASAALLLAGRYTEQTALLCAQKAARYENNGTRGKGMQESERFTATR